MFEILVIDDDKNTRRLMNAILLGAGYTPVLAEDGEKALEIYNKHHVDMVIADIMMINIDDYELKKIIKKRKKYKMPMKLLDRHLLLELQIV